MNCLLKDGCPCSNKKCENWGDCAKCIKNHVENREYTVACLRKKRLKPTS